MNGGGTLALNGAFEFLRVLGDKRPGVVVHGDDVARLEQIGRDDGVLWSHREIVADWEQGVIKLFQFADQRHVAEQGRIAGKVERNAANVDDEAAGVAARNARTMKRKRNPYVAEGEVVLAA